MKQLRKWPPKSKLESGMNFFHVQMNTGKEPSLVWWQLAENVFVFDRRVPCESRGQGAKNIDRSNNSFIASCR